MSSPLNERIQRLQIGEAKGVLKPEHQAELDSYRRQGMIKTPTGGGYGRADRDLKALQEASARSDAASKSLRLYDSITPALERFNPGPLKGTIYDMVMPNEGGGFLDGAGALLGGLVRPLLPDQDEDDYQRINAARAERIGLRSQEQKGVQAKNDEIQFRLADISPSKSFAVNRDIIDRQRTDSLLAKQRALLESRWINKYGSTATPNPQGTSFQEALEASLGRYEQGMRKSRLPSAPPSTRKGRPTVYDLDGNPIQ